MSLPTLPKLPSDDLSGEEQFATPPAAMLRVRQAGRVNPAVLLTLLLMSALLLGAAVMIGWSALSPETLPDAMRSIVGAPPPTTQGETVTPLDVPAVEPNRYLDVSPEDARALNAKVPFSTRPNPPAAPFGLSVEPVDLQRAIDCLAAASWYEAGDDPVGGAAVAQVILNRVRHPSFANSVCGVVFQGAERRTGCQFTFTCDGALARTPSAAAWARARQTAISALGGFVFRPVGWATHYHTDWVVPYWSTSVDKTAAVGTHLFFRWRGGAGNAAAFRQPYAGKEPVIAALARLSPAHAGTLETDPTAVTELALTNGATAAGSVPAEVPETVQTRQGTRLSARDASSGSFALDVQPGTFAGDVALSALDLCRPVTGACSVFGSTKGALRIGASGRPADLAPVDFYYYRDQARGRERVLWNCAIWKRARASECLQPTFQPD
jgi:spore germination cell wall hydrolase CwlJ-like protein